MYRREPVLDLGGYDEATGPAEDKDLWRKLALERFEARIVPEALVRYRLHDLQLSQTRADVSASRSTPRARTASSSSSRRTRTRRRCALLLAGDPEAWHHDARRRCAASSSSSPAPATRLALTDAEARRLGERVARRLLDVATSQPWHPSARAVARYAIARLPASAAPTLGGSARHGPVSSRDADVGAGARRPSRDRGRPSARAAVSARAPAVRKGDGQRMSVDVDAVRQGEGRDRGALRPVDRAQHPARRRAVHDLAGARRRRGEAPPRHAARRRRVRRIARGVRVLDLASLEGMYALELARRGADVVAIEGREANVEKARFAARDARARRRLPARRRARPVARPARRVRPRPRPRHPLPPRRRRPLLRARADRRRSARRALIVDTGVGSRRRPTSARRPTTGGCASSSTAPTRPRRNGATPCGARSTTSPRSR